MSALTAFGLVLLGTLVGVLGGILGIGGGIIIVPLLIFLFGFDAKTAVGTSLGVLLPPVGIFAFLEYWSKNSVNLKAALILAVCFALGAWLGSKLSTSGRISVPAVRVLFALFMIYMASAMLFRSDPGSWAVFRSILVLLAAITFHGALMLIGKRWDRKFSLEQVYRNQRDRAQIPDYEI